MTVGGEREELRYLYALDGSLTASISSTDILEYTYDERGYVKTVEKNNEHKLGLVYDGNGNLTLLKELTSGTYTPNSITSYKYDTRGYLTEVYSGGTLTYKVSGYDRDGYAIFSETAEGGELLASYLTRADGLIEQVTDGAGNVTMYQYNQQKQVTGLTITTADGTTLYSETNSYDKNGSLLSQNISGAGYDTEKHTYTYDAVDRLLNETKNGTWQTNTYDASGIRSMIAEHGVTTEFMTFNGLVSPIAMKFLIL